MNKNIFIILIMTILSLSSISVRAQEIDQKVKFNIYNNTKYYLQINVWRFVVPDQHDYSMTARADDICHGQIFIDIIDEKRQFLGYRCFVHIDYSITPPSITLEDMPNPKVFSCHLNDSDEIKQITISEV